MGQSMAEKGAPFQATDVASRPDLPRRRFVHAVQQKCRLTISYEQGGIAHSWLRLILVWDRTGWRRGI